jgi:hypothetical protein
LRRFYYRLASTLKRTGSTTVRFMCTVTFTRITAGPFLSSADSGNRRFHPEHQQTSLLKADFDPEKNSADCEYQEGSVEKHPHNNLLNLRKFFLRDRTVSIVELNKNGPQMLDKGTPGPC